MGALALVALAAVSVPLAAAGPKLVPAAEATHSRSLLGLYDRGFGLGGRAFLALLLVSFAIHVAVLTTVGRVRSQIVWIAIVGIIVLFLLAPPLLSADVFGYISYGRLAAGEGLNPYDAVSADRDGDAVHPLVGWPNTPSMYGPMFTAGTLPLGWVTVFTALWILKLVSAASVVALAAISARVAEQRGLCPKRAAALVALNPLVLAHVVGGAHNDALMSLAVMAAVLAVERRREAAGGVAIIIAALGVKASAIFAVPFLLLGAGHRKRAWAGVAAATAGVSAFAWAMYGSDALAPLRLVGQNQSATSRHSIPARVSLATGVPAAFLRSIAVMVLALVLLGLLWWTARGADWIDATAWAGVVLLLTTSWLLPWYVVWVLPLAAVARDRRVALTMLALSASLLFSRIPS